MLPVARVLRHLPWLVWVYLLLGAPVTTGPAPSAAVEINSGCQHSAGVSGSIGNAYDTGARLEPATRHAIDEGPANNADTVDPAGLPPLALALTSPTRAPARSSVRVSRTVAGLHSFSPIGPLGSRPPPLSL